MGDKKKYLVHYVVYDNDYWHRIKSDTIVEAFSKEDAKKIVEDQSSCVEEYIVLEVREYEDK
jgi:hypothetical protein